MQFVYMLIDLMSTCKERVVPIIDPGLEGDQVTMPLLYVVHTCSLYNLEKPETKVVVLRSRPCRRRLTAITLRAWCCSVPLWCSRIAEMQAPMTSLHAVSGNLDSISIWFLPLDLEQCWILSSASVSAEDTSSGFLQSPHRRHWLDRLVALRQAHRLVSNHNPRYVNCNLVVVRFFVELLYRLLLATVGVLCKMEN
jgi:hypothetical protein